MKVYMFTTHIIIVIVIIGFHVYNMENRFTDNGAHAIRTITIAVIRLCITQFFNTYANYVRPEFSSLSPCGIHCTNVNYSREIESRARGASIPNSLATKRRERTKLSTSFNLNNRWTSNGLFLSISNFFFNLK